MWGSKIKVCSTLAPETTGSPPHRTTPFVEGIIILCGRALNYFNVYLTDTIKLWIILEINRNIYFKCPLLCQKSIKDRFNTFGCFLISRTV